MGRREEKGEDMNPLDKKGPSLAHKGEVQDPAERGKKEGVGSEGVRPECEIN